APWGGSDRYGAGLRWPRSTRGWRAPALWRGREVQLDRLAASARAWLDGDLSGTGLEDQRRGLLGAGDTDPGAEHPAARAVATRLVRCQSDLAHRPSPLAQYQRARVSARITHELFVRSHSLDDLLQHPLLLCTWPPS